MTEIPQKKIIKYTEMKGHPAVVNSKGKKSYKFKTE
jgi:hypothetical protein